MKTLFIILKKSVNICFQTEVSSKELGLNLGSDHKRFDFVVKSGELTYLIETNFYNVGGSKLNEVARAYIKIAQEISRFNGFKFVWITDGQGWLSSKNELKEAYKSVKIYNLSTLHLFAGELKNGR
ncbi:DpnII family type II restriction endonuclease [Campylobacter sp.]|uniref:DpnII family type II restriction endonuclease n=1 Tax=Campylobacter sp. TaxID=205 RepID=UPI00403E5B6D